MLKHRTSWKCEGDNYVIKSPNGLKLPSDSNSKNSQLRKVNDIEKLKHI